MKEVYKWDVEEMQYCVKQMETQKSNLVQYQKEIANLQTDIAGAWQSIAGTVYEDAIYIDKKLLIQIIEKLEKEINKLNHVINKAYQPCEENLRREVGQLAGNIKAL